MIGAGDESDINRILAAKNLYEVLKISNTATYGEIHSAYKKLSLLVHPDKNNSSRAKDAFIAVQRATAILLDKNKRNEYDKYLRSPTGFCAQKFDISDDEANKILISAGFISAMGIATGLYAIYNWFTSSRKQENSVKDVKYTK